MAFAGQDLYASLEAKSTALCFSLVSNHPFLDGNKRVGHAAVETSLILNGFELNSSVEEAERIILALASGELARDQLLNWVTTHIKPLSKT
jgi:death-on-curing protein